MPVYRTPDGRIVEEKTKPTADKPADVTRTEGEHSLPPASNTPSGGESPLDAPTRKIGAGSGPKARTATKDDEKTRVVGGRRHKSDAARVAASADRADKMDDPVVGWLVVVDGPGKGRHLALGYGANSIGRDKTERVVLDFGDDQISRNGHAVVTYDPKGRTFFLQHGGAKNLVYVDDAPVLAPTAIESATQFQLGSTTLRFIPLCGELFDWQDTE
jgi:hypothetical protein